MSQHVTEKSVKEFENKVSSLKDEIASVRESLSSSRQKNESFLSILNDIKNEIKKIDSLETKSLGLA